MTRFCFSVDDDNDDTTDSEVDYENEPPHPLGFSGQSRYKFSTDDSETDFDDDDDNNNSLWNGPQEQLYPPVSSSLYVNTMTSPMKDLVRHALESQSEQRRIARRDNDNDRKDGLGRNDDDDDNPVDVLTRALRDGAMFGISSSPRSQALIESSPSTARSLQLLAPATTGQLLDTTYASLPRQEAQIQHEMTSTRQGLERDHEESNRNVKALLDATQKKADAERARRLQEQKERQAKLDAEQKAKEDRLAAQRQKEQQEQQALQKEQEEQRRVEEQKQQALRAAAAKKKAATEYMTQAEKKVSQLVQLRASVEPFETSKPMAKRRLGMKKIVNGRVNTLSEDVSKVRAVVADVLAAIATARQEDVQYKTELEAGKPGFTPEMTRGKRYLLDLLSATVVKRVQAEGFNGQRGDGFPLAAMLAAVSVEAKDLNPVLAAHIYTVCPTAIPKLPTPAPEASEEELMESLGMLKGKNGEYETFERFLARTEGLISIVADIMSSVPPEHTLFGGHEGAVLWLGRFLSQLPAAPQSPLPLLTAPVLDAFLTGAGHMLANKHPDEFQKHLQFITDDCLPRIDEGTIGKPSATRLKKTVEGGFEGFKNKLPSRALAELYYGANPSGATATTTSSSAPSFGTATPNPFGASTQAPASSAPNPFGANASASASTSAPNPFGGGPSATTQTQNTATAAPSPFGGTPAASASSFGSFSSSQNQPFGGASGQNASMNVSAPTTSSPFGGAGAAAAPSPFGATAAPSPSPFGGSAAAPVPSAAPIPSPFGPNAPVPASSPFVTSSAPAPTPFGGSAAAASPFGGNSNAPAPSPFGAAVPSPSPFGAAAPAPSPFSASAAPAPSPFGAAAPSPSPFGTSAAPAPSPFGTAAPAPFGASAAPSPSPFGASSPPFGARAAPTPSPFGAPAGASPSPFGAAAPSPSPFGAPAGQQSSPFGAAAAPSPSPFGAAAPSPSPFGSAPPAASSFGQSPFGGGLSSGNQGSQFGGAPNNSKPPCRFFARGNCRNGSNCRFSHDISGGGGGGAGGGAFGSGPTPFSSPFGGPRR